MGAIRMPGRIHAVKAGALHERGESFYDWEDHEWLVPIRVAASKATRIGRQLVSLGGGSNYWVESPDGGPAGWGARLTITLLF